MKEVIDIKTKTYEHINNGETFYVDIVTDFFDYLAYIYHIDYGVKQLMFGIPKGTHTYDEFVALVESNIDRYIDVYREEEMD